jgi:A/G-specific adenine glycosylase
VLRPGVSLSPRPSGTLFQVTLLAWSAETRRDLPWRRTRDPWKVLVSEFMLQQTQVARVIRHYNDFIERFPTPTACAAAEVGEVVRMWAGLGYNRRAVNLHRAATVIEARHNGTMPSELADLMALPGVGPYTARAVMAFAFEADVGLVETNSARVLARAVAGRAMHHKQAQTTADSLVQPKTGWAWNQAVFDLGATVCVKRSPSCGACPVINDCAWSRAGRPAPDPAEGTAGATRLQSRFEGSHRQGRGRLVAALRAGPLATDDIAAVAGWPADPARARRAADDLVSEGLAQNDGNVLRLP